MYDKYLSKFQLVRYSAKSDVDQALYDWYNQNLNKAEKSQWYPIGYYSVVQVYII